MTAEHQETPARPLRPVTTHDHRVADAARIVATLEGTDEATALESLHTTAQRAGVGVDEIARGVLLFHGD